MYKCILIPENDCVLIRQNKCLLSYCVFYYPSFQNITVFLRVCVPERESVRKRGGESVCER